MLTFADDQTYYGYDVGAVDITKGSTALSIEINTSSTATGVKTRPEYDYSRLGDTWSSPRIMRIPNNGAGDMNINDDIYVAVMGGGYAGVAAGVGSNVTIVNLEDNGKLYKNINIKDIGKDGGTDNGI